MSLLLVEVLCDCMRKVGHSGRAHWHHVAPRNQYGTLHSFAGSWNNNRLALLGDEVLDVIVLLHAMLSSPADEGSKGDKSGNPPSSVITKKRLPA